MMDPKSIVRDGYDKASFAYHDGKSGAYPFDYAGWIGRLLQGFELAHRFLDLGSGNGEPASRLLAEHGRVIGVDLSPVQIQRAIQAGIPRAEFRCADMCDLEFP